MFQAERTARGKPPCGREPDAFCVFEEMRDQNGWKVRAKIAWCRMRLGICVGSGPLRNVKVSVFDLRAVASYWAATWLDLSLKDLFIYMCGKHAEAG